MKVNKENLIEWLDNLADNIESKDYEEALDMIDNFASILNATNEFTWINILGHKKQIIIKDKN
ncbi:MAG: hypothetical protein PPFGHCPK_01444 (plasmid) [Spiroplasma endosymbiont of Drosophila atripex]|nr:MAG: hypothetical protein PPFGHCPK_01444 [Spiroplasma endosymbiont of Drosophila atripex]